MIARTTNSPRQDVTCSSAPPMIGPRIGATPTTTIRIEKRRAAAAPETRSRTTEREITIPADPLSPWTSRRPIRTQMFGAAAHASDAAK